MKNLTIKNIALGLFLAGYTASSAFAITATTNDTIRGNKPVLQSSDSGTNHTVTVKAYHKTKPLAPGQSITTGDRVVVSYHVADADGDTESTAGESGKTLVFGYEKPAGTFNFVAITRDIKNGEVEFKIPDEASEAVNVGFKIQANTQFGDPASGDWIYVSNIFATEKPGTKPTKPGPGDVCSTNPCPPTGPGVPPTGGTGPVVPNKERLGIFHVPTGAGGVLDDTVDLSQNAGAEITYGQTYEMLAWNDVDGDKLPGNSEPKTNDDYTKFTWFIEAGDSNTLVAPSNVTTLSADFVLKTVTGTGVLAERQITLGNATTAPTSGGWNGVYNPENAKAGIQGFKLSAKMEE